MMRPSGSQAVNPALPIASMYRPSGSPSSPDRQTPSYLMTRICRPAARSEGARKNRTRIAVDSPRLTGSRWMAIRFLPLVRRVRSFLRIDGPPERGSEGADEALDGAFGGGGEGG